MGKARVLGPCRQLRGLYGVLGTRRIGAAFASLRWLPGERTAMEVILAGSAPASPPRDVK